MLYFLANSAWCFGRLPEYQGCGVASLLLREVIELADRHDPPQLMYLEAMPAARPIYGRFGWGGVEGKVSEFVMIRRGLGESGGEGEGRKGGGGVKRCVILHTT